MFAATMLFGMSMTVFAVSDNDVTGNDVTGNDVETVSGSDVIGGEQKIEMGGTVQTPTLKVTITKGKTVIANPYGLEDSTLGLTTDETLKGSTIEFKNESDTPIAVGLAGQVKLADYDTMGTEKADRVTIADSLSSLNTATTKQVYIQAIVTSDGEEAHVLQTSSDRDEKPLVYGKSNTELSNTPVLAAGGKAAAGSGNSDTMILVISGGTSKSPTSQWTDADEFTVVTIYDLQFGNSKKLSKFKA